LNGNGHTISNLNNLSLFNSITGSIENLNIHNFTNIGSVTSDDITAFAKLTNGATLKNLKFENITLEGRHRVSVVASFDNANSTFENISVKNANVKGSGVYVSTFIGRKYGGVVRNVFVEGTLEITTTENGGIIGAFQKGGTLENVISKVNIHKTGNTYTPVEKSEFNGGIIGNIYDNPVIKNSLALGNMKGFTNANGEEKIPFKDFDLAFVSPSIVHSAILDFDDKSNYPYEKALSELNHLRCKSLEVRFYSPNQDKLNDILYESQSSTLQNIEICHPYCATMSAASSCISTRRKSRPMCRRTPPRASSR